MTGITKTVILSTLLALIIPFWAPAGPTHGTETIPIFYIDARGQSGFEIGNELGRLIIAKFPDIAQTLDSYLDYAGYILFRMGRIGAG